MEIGTAESIAQSIVDIKGVKAFIINPNRSNQSDSELHQISLAIEIQYEYLPEEGVVNVRWYKNVNEGDMIDQASLDLQTEILEQSESLSALNSLMALVTNPAEIFIGRYTGVTFERVSHHNWRPAPPLQKPFVQQYGNVPLEFTTSDEEFSFSPGWANREHFRRTNNRFSPVVKRFLLWCFFIGLEPQKTKMTIEQIHQIYCGYLDRGLIQAPLLSKGQIRSWLGTCAAKYKRGTLEKPLWFDPERPELIYMTPPPITTDHQLESAASQAIFHEDHPSIDLAENAPQTVENRPSQVVIELNFPVIPRAEVALSTRARRTSHNSAR